MTTKTIGFFAGLSIGFACSGAVVFFAIPENEWLALWLLSLSIVFSVTPWYWCTFWRGDEP